MSLTNIDFNKSKGILKQLTDELVEVINVHTVEASVLEKEELQDLLYLKELALYYTNATVRFQMRKNATLQITIWISGDFRSALNLEKAREFYALLLQHVTAYLKKEKINLFVSLTCHCSVEKGVDITEHWGADNFADFERKNKAVPLSDELKELQEVIPVLSKDFPINANGRSIETGKNKFRKIYNLDAVNQDGVAKIGVFHDDDLLLAIGSAKEAADLVALKASKLDELQKVKEDAIKELSIIDPSFSFDGKNGVVFFGEKATISIEYDVFKNQYLMMFLKSKVIAPTIKAVDDKVKNLIVKKTKIKS